jgi:hypothetical protein
MAVTYRGQSRLRNSQPNLVVSSARNAGIPDGGDAVNWLWLNIPLMAVFFMAMTGIPIWLVVKHPDLGPATGRTRSSRTRSSGQAGPRREPTAMPARPIPVYLPSNRDRYAQVGR